MILVEYKYKTNIKNERELWEMERLLTNLQLFLLIITGLLRDTSEVCEELKYNKQEKSITIKTVINYFENIILIDLRNRVNIIHYKLNRNFKMKISSERYDRFSDVKYIECMRC